MNEIIEKQIRAVPNLKRLKRVAFYEPRAGNQIHMDTMFWAESGVKDSKLIPILVIVDVATRFTQYHLQTTKNEHVLKHLTSFRTALKEMFPNANPYSVVMTDGARELAAALREDKTLKHKVSSSMNKAVLAEMAIARIRKKLRSIELALNVRNLQQDEEHHINYDALKVLLPAITEEFNLKAKQKEEPQDPAKQEVLLRITTPVFLINLHKFFPYQMKDVLRKKSYDHNWYLEPYRISARRTVKGVSSYQLKDYISGDTLQYWFYRDQLQPIDIRVASDYINNWARFHGNREDTDFF